MVTVFIPEYVVGHWWEQILHNQSALRLKGRLLFTPGVMVTSVPWQLSSPAELDERLRDAGDIGPVRGRPDDRAPRPAARSPGVGRRDGAGVRVVRPRRRPEGHRR